MLKMTIEEMVLAVERIDGAGYEILPVDGNLKRISVSYKEMHFVFYETVDDTWKNMLKILGDVLGNYADKYLGVFEQLMQRIFKVGFMIRLDDSEQAYDGCVCDYSGKMRFAFIFKYLPREKFIDQIYQEWANFAEETASALAYIMNCVGHETLDRNHSTACVLRKFYPADWGFEISDDKISVFREIAFAKEVREVGVRKVNGRWEGFVARGIYDNNWCRK